MSYTATDTASLGATAREVALSFPLQCLVPAVVLTVVGVTCRHLITRVRPSIFGDAGLSLHRAALASALAGLAVGAVSFLPLHFGPIVILSSALFSLCAALIAWSARESFSAAGMGIGVMMLTVGAVDVVLLLVDAAWGPIPEPHTTGTDFGIMWVLYALPGLVAAGLAAALSTMPAKEAARIRRAEQARAAAQDSTSLHSTSLRLRRSVTTR